MPIVPRLLTVLLMWATLCGPASSQAQTDTAEDKPNADEKLSEELDNLLLGAWSQIEGGLQAKLSEQTLIDAIKACTVPIKIQRLNIQSDAAKELPAPTLLVGTVTYYRTEKGLQRFEAGNGTLLLLEEIKKEEAENGRSFWRLSGKAIALRLVFATRKAPNRDLVLMIEEGRPFLRCPRLNTTEDAEEDQ